MLMRRNAAADIGSNEQGEYCRAALQRSDCKEPRYKWSTLLYFYFLVTQVSCQNQNECDHTQVNHTLNNWFQYCYSLVGLPNLNKSKRLLLL